MTAYLAQEHSPSAGAADSHNLQKNGLLVWTETFFCWQSFLYQCLRYRNTSYTITATATHGEGAVPVTNLGNEYAAGKIAAGNKSKATGKITGYRNSFYGTLKAKDGEVNSALVRGLSGKSGKALAAGNSFNLAIPVGAIRVVFAYPATLRDVTELKQASGYIVFNCGSASVNI